MENIFINGTVDSPTISIDFEKGVFELIGKSIPEDVIKSYQIVFNSVKMYNPKPLTTFNMKLDYFNTSSQKQILNIIDELKNKCINTEFIVNWYYTEEDEDSVDCGKMMSNVLLIPFNYIFY